MKKQRIDKVLIACVLIGFSTQSWATVNHGGWTIIDNEHAADEAGEFGVSGCFVLWTRSGGFGTSDHQLQYGGYNNPPLIDNAINNANYPTGVTDDQWLIFDSRSTFMMRQSLGQVVGTISDGLYSWSITVGRRSDVGISASFKVGLFAFTNGIMTALSTLDQTDLAPGSGLHITTNITWNSTGSTMAGSPLLFAMVNYDAYTIGGGTRQICFDGVSVKKDGGAELVVNGSFEVPHVTKSTNVMPDGWQKIPNRATWIFKNLAAGDYEVVTMWEGYSNRTTVPFSVNGVVSATVNQVPNPSELAIEDDGTWQWAQSIGTYAAVGGSITVTVPGLTGDKYVIADAIAVRPVKDATGGNQVQNFSFEAPDAGTSSLPWGTRVPGWSRVGGGHPGLIVHASGAAPYPVAPDGDQWMLLDSRGTFNGGTVTGSYLGRVEKNRKYVWSATLGNRSDLDYVSEVELGLYIAENNIFTACDTLDESAITMAQRSRTTQLLGGKWYSVDTGTEGKHLYFLMSVTSSGITPRQLLIDDVRVFSSKVHQGTILLVQ